MQPLPLSSNRMNTGGIVGRIFADRADELKEGRRRPGKIGRRSETQRLRDEAAALKTEAAGASAKRRQQIASRMVALTAELELMTLGWEETAAAELPKSFAPPRPAPAEVTQQMAQKRDTRSFFRSNAEYGMLEDPAIALPRGGGRQPPRHGRRSKVRRGMDVRYPTMHLGGAAGAGDLAASVPEELDRARDVLVRKQGQRSQDRDQIFAKAFRAGQDVVQGHAPNHHLEPALGFSVPVAADAIAAEHHRARAAAAQQPAARGGTPLAGQTQIIHGGRAHTPSIPAHSKYFGRNVSNEVAYAEAVYKATGVNPHVGRSAATKTARSGPI